MSWAPDYATTDELKALLRIADTEDDAALAFAITSASRALDHEANRQFGKADSATPRYYEYGGGEVACRPAIEIDDLMDTSGLLVAVDTSYNFTYLTSLSYGVDYDLWPWNAAADGKPFTHIVLRPFTGTNIIPYFPMGARAVRVTAAFGWTDVPALVKQATLIQAGRFFVRRDSLYGLAGSPEIGSQVRLLARLDPDVALMVSACRRWWGAVSVGR